MADWRRRLRALRAPLEHQNFISSLAFSRDGSRVLTGSHDGTAQLWDAATGRPIGAPLGHEGEVYAVAFSRDGSQILTASWDKTARLWDSPAGPVTFRRNVPRQTVERGRPIRLVSCPFC